MLLSSYRQRAAAESSGVDVAARVPPSAADVAASSARLDAALLLSGSGDHVAPKGPRCKDCGRVARSDCAFQRCRPCCESLRNYCEIHPRKISAFETTVCPDCAGIASKKCRNRRCRDCCKVTGAECREHGHVGVATVYTTPYSRPAHSTASPDLGEQVDDEEYSVGKSARNRLDKYRAQRRPAQELKKYEMDRNRSTLPQGENARDESYGSDGDSNVSDEDPRQESSLFGATPAPTNVNAALEVLNEEVKVDRVKSASPSSRRVPDVQDEDALPASATAVDVSTEIAAGVPDLKRTRAVVVKELEKVSSQLDQARMRRAVAKAELGKLSTHRAQWTRHGATMSSGELDEVAAEKAREKARNRQALKERKAEPKGDVRFTVRRLGGWTIPLIVGLATETQLLKEHIEKEKGIPANRQRLVLDGRQMIDGNLYENNVNDGSIIYLIEQGEKAEDPGINPVGPPTRAEPPGSPVPPVPGEEFGRKIVEARGLLENAMRAEQMLISKWKRLRQEVSDIEDELAMARQSIEDENRDRELGKHILITVTKVAEWSMKVPAQLGSRVSDIKKRIHAEKGILAHQQRLIHHETGRTIASGVLNDHKLRDGSIIYVMSLNDRSSPAATVVSVTED